VLLGAFAVNFATTGDVPTSIGIAIGNMLEGVAGAWLVERFAAGRRAFERAIDTIRFFALAGIASPVISASIGVATLWLGGLMPPADAASTWLTWWLGDLGGALIAAPVVILGFGGGRPRWSRRRAIEAALFFSVLIAACLAVLSGYSPLSRQRYPVQFLCLPLLILVAFRFGLFASATAVLLTAAIAIAGTLKGTGPFARDSAHESLLLLQAFMVVVALTTLTLAAAVRERAAAQSALEATARELARSNADLEWFAHAASHDLKEPLRSVAGFTQLLADRYRGRLGPDADEFMRYALQGTARLERLIDDLLAYARAGSGGCSPVRTSVDDALSQAIERLRAAIDAAGAVVVRDRLPTVTADPGQLVLLFQNLLGNAVKFRGADPPRIGISAHRTPREWVISVRDNGIGIDPRFAPRVFTMFQRWHGREEHDGSGIGLALCKRIVERHGGRIWMESKPGAGSTFHFTLPEDGSS
jgi:signal transduction histidine kinase